MEIVWSEMSLKQLDDILNYIEEDFGEMTARNSLQKISKKVETLKKCPELGIIDHLYTSKVTANKITIRHLNIGPNVLYYNVYNEQINIMAITHSKQSPRTIIQMIKRYYEQSFIQ